MQAEIDKFSVSNYQAPIHPPNIKDQMSLLSLKKEFQHSAFHSKVVDILYPDYPMWRKIRGDGNCCYRAIYVQYLELLISKHHLHLQNLKKLIDSNRGIFRASHKNPEKTFPERNMVLKYLSQLQSMKRAGTDNRDVMKMFHQMVKYSQAFDLVGFGLSQGMVRLLRLMVANLIRKNKNLEIEGLPIEAIMDPNYESLEDYVQNNVMKMGMEAQDLIVELLPIVLRISIKTVLLDKSAGNGGILQNLKKPFIGQEKVQFDDSLNLHNSVLNILLKPGHYDILYSTKFLQETGMDQEESKEDAEQQEEMRDSRKRFEGGAKYRSKSVSGASPQYVEDQRQPRESITYKLHCLHAVNRIEMTTYLNDKFPRSREQDLGPARFLIIYQERKRKVRPSCPKCFAPLSFEDLKEFDRSLIRKEFSQRKKEWTNCWYKEASIEQMQPRGRGSVKMSSGGLRYKSENRKEQNEAELQPRDKIIEIQRENKDKREMRENKWSRASRYSSNKSQPPTQQNRRPYFRTQFGQRSYNQMGLNQSHRNLKFMKYQDEEEKKEPFRKIMIPHYNYQGRLLKDRQIRENEGRNYEEVPAYDQEIRSGKRDWMLILGVGSLFLILVILFIK